MKIALLGAESTGKSSLAQAMARSLRASGWRVQVVPELLRTWCEREGRMPRPEELLPLAQAQEARVDEAQAEADIAIADTTALLLAVHGGLLFRDHPLVRMAFERQRGYALTLLTGLDLPWQPDGLMRQGPQAREPVDAILRQLLAEAGVPFKVVYGSGPQRLHNALQAVAETAPLAWPLEDVPEPRWTGLCGDCDDGACEHRLFRRLIGRVD
jgi:nicotinamide riboside kinase